MRAQKRSRLLFFLLLFNVGLSTATSTGRFNDGLSSSTTSTGRVRREEQEALVYNATDIESNSNTTSVDAIIENIFETYLPLVAVLSSLSANETAELAHQSLRHLKADIESLNLSTTANDSLLFDIEEGQMTEIVGILKEYHKSRVYSIISALWESALDEQLPRLDQFAILEYFEDRKKRVARNSNIFSRIWTAIKKLFNPDDAQPEKCPADDPAAVRFIVDTFPIEKRVELDRAARSNDSAALMDMIEAAAPNEIILDELREWRANITIPAPLRSIIDSASEPQRIALARLRELQLISSLRDYYGTLIERRAIEEQEEIRAFFARMTDSFLGCFSDSNDHNEYWKYEY